MSGRVPNLFVSAGAFIIGAIVVYYVISTHTAGGDFAGTFRQLTPSWRALVVAGFIATAYGTGGLCCAAEVKWNSRAVIGVS